VPCDCFRTPVHFQGPDICNILEIVQVSRQIQKPQHIVQPPKIRNDKLSDETFIAGILPPLNAAICCGVKDVLTQDKIYFIQNKYKVPHGLIGNSVKIGSGPAAVIGDESCNKPLFRFKRNGKGQ